MNVMKLLDAVLLVFTSCLFGQESDQETRKTPDSSRTKAAEIALFTFNRAGDIWNDRMRAFEDLITAEVVRLGMNVISPELTTSALSEFPNVINQNNRDNIPGIKLDQILSNNTSAFRLASNLGADYLLAVSLVSYGTTSRDVRAYGNTFFVTEFTLRLNFRLAKGLKGGTILSDSVELSNTIRQTDFQNTKDEDLRNRLLYDGSKKLGQQLEAKLSLNRNRMVNHKQVEEVGFRVDVVLSGFKIPEITTDEQGQSRIGLRELTVNPVGVTVELDGVSIGSAPGSFTVKPGIHKMRLSREGFKDWERTVNIYQGQILTVAMEWTDSELQRWMDKVKFILKLKQEETLTKAENETLLGFAQFLRQSGYLVDYRVNTTEAPTTNVNGSPNFFQNGIEKKLNLP